MGSPRTFDAKRGIVIPKEISPKICELVGINYGDGNMHLDKSNGRHDYRISYSGDLTYDLDYMYKIDNTFNR